MIAPFEYHRPATLDDALGLLALHGAAACVLGGGTDLVPRLRAGAVAPAHLVSLGAVPGLDGLELRDDGLHVGASARIADVGAHPVVRRHFPSLAHACRVMATTQVRNMGTVAGNLANASPCADTASPLLVHDAELELARTGERRRVPLRGFHLGNRKTVLAPSELVLSLRVPLPPERAGCAYERLSARSEVDMAAVGVAAFVALDAGGRIAVARLAMNAVGPTPLLCPEASALLAGAAPTDAARLAEAAEACRRAARPIDDVRATAAYRRHIVGVLARRVLARAAARALGGEP